MTTSNGTISFALLQRMLSFIQGLLYYMTNEVIEPTYSQLKKHLKENVSTIDEVLARHTDFLDRCLKDCLLTNREVVELNDHLLQCCLGYATFMQGLNDFDDDALTTVKECETNFSRDLNALLGILNEMAKIESERLWNHLITRLDYNNFYNY
jgi:gamma-tubulin complex component 2